MYPTLYHALFDLFGWELAPLKLVNSFGFFVALAFVAASAVLKREMRRLTALGHFQGQKETITIGEAPQWLDLASQGFMGFLLGWKVLYLFVHAGTLFQGTTTPQRFLFSGDGNVLWGIIGAILLVVWRYREVQKERLPEPKTVEKDVPPWEFVGGITAAAAIGGIAGAKLFHLLENPDELVAFFTAPSLNAFLGGLTIYGGLIVGGISVYLYARKKGLNFLRLADATAPGLLLAYGIGRMGCQISGDGDWGISNTAPKPGWLSWAPDWIWAYAYPNNVNKWGKMMDPASSPWDAFPGYGTYLDPMVFPTPIYETTLSILGFALLWKLRTRWAQPGKIFAAYLMFNGVERFWIEKIRINNTFEFLGMTMTQAELISVCMFLSGVALWVWATRKQKV